MKKALFIFGLLFLASCEDPIDITLPAHEKRVVIDAMLWRPVGETSGTLEVVLSNTTGFYNEAIPYIEGATVTLKNQDVIFTAQENEKGHYKAVNIPVLLNETFELAVAIEGATYSASESLVLSVPIDSITQGKETLISGEETEAIVQFTDRPEEQNYYVMDFGYNNLFVTRDEFYNGEQLTFSFFYDKYFPKNTPTPIHLMGANKAFYTYMQILISHAGQDGGGPFATAKSTLRGNIQNTTTPNDFPLGYFRVVERDTFVFTATEN